MISDFAFARQRRAADDPPPGCSGIRSFWVRAAAVLSVLLLGASGRAGASGTVSNCNVAEFLAAAIGGGRVVLACEGTITMTNMLVISANTSIEASTRATISGNAVSRLFYVTPGVELRLVNITVANGRVEGASETNGVPGGIAQGGAIFNEGGIVTLINSTLSTNFAVGGEGGLGRAGGFGKEGEEGGSGGDGLGGAIFNYGGQIYASNCVFAANAALGGLGGSGGTGSSSGNTADGGPGGRGGSGQGAAVFSTLNGVARFIACTFSSNRVEGASSGFGGVPGGVLGFPGRDGAPGEGVGAALFTDSGSLEVDSSTFVFNFALGAPGAEGDSGAGGSLARDGENGGAGGSARGGAIYAGGGSLAATNSTFCANIVQPGEGGLGGDGGSGGFGGDGGQGGNGGAGFGGGVCCSGVGAAVLVNCTFSANQIWRSGGGRGGNGAGLGKDGGAGAPGSGAGAGVFSENGGMRLVNTLLANAVPNVQNNCGGSIADGGHNLSNDGSCGFTVTGSLNNTNARLAGLGEFGGPTRTIGLEAGSPAINAGDDNAAPRLDQRRIARVGRSDIGAFEFGGTLAELVLGISMPATPATSALVTWPLNSVNERLETSSSLAPGAAWSPAAVTVTTTNGQNSALIFRSSTTNQFFRLAIP